MHTIARATVLAAAFTCLSAAGLAASPAASPGAIPAIAGPAWFLTAYIAEDGGRAGAAATAAITFDADTLSGETGCHRFTGPWTSDGTSLTIGTLAITPAPCDPDVVGQDMAVLGALREVATYRSTGGVLELLDAAGHPRLTYGSIEGRTWVPILGADETTPRAIVTLALLDGVASGQAPCNQFSAPYQLDGTSLSIWPISTTQSTCPDQDLEDRYLSNIASARAWTIDAGDLVLIDELDAPVRTFAAASAGD